MQHSVILYFLIITQTCIINVQGMLNETDLSMYTNLLNQERNAIQKVKDCVLFSYNIDQINNQITYILYKKVSKNDESSTITYTTDTIPQEHQKGPIAYAINQGNYFFDRDATLEYPDTLEMRYDPIKNVLTHYILYRQGNIIFNIPCVVHIYRLNFSPTDLLKNVTTTIKHNGWYPERIYPNIQKDPSAYYLTWQHKTYLGLQCVLILLVVSYTANKIIRYVIGAYKK